MRRLGVFRYEAVSSIALVAAAIAIAAVAVHREFGNGATPTRSTGVSPQLDYMPGWKNLADGGVLIGDRDAPVKVFEFADLECPFCKAFLTTFRGTKQRFGSQIALVFIHYPLRSHRFAKPAARALECAGDQGRFAGFLDAVYDKQDSLGLKPWSSYALEADVPDTARFRRCAAQAGALTRVDGGLALGAKVGVRGTPTIVVNGWRFSAPPRQPQLDSVISDLLAGRTPRKSSASRVTQ